MAKFRGDADDACRFRHPACRGRIPLTGIAGQECLRLLRRPLVRSLQRTAARCRHGEPVLRPESAGSMDPFREFALRFFVQSPKWRIGAVSINILRKQFDKTYVAVSFINNDREIMLNFIVVDGPNGWVILDVESPHDSLRMFLTQYKN
jgi:hypothetical protein